uniref:Fibronectin type-III domain-containing protein n=1 Tax=Amphimedon queenslandica TaxID=400682 RepID=A0A1X7TVM2_AMPQE
MGKALSLLLFLLSTSVGLEDFFFLTPKQTNVIVGRAVFLECGTHNDGYTLTFVYAAPPGYSVSSQTLNEDIAGGGRKINTTFIVTKELNTTTVRCLAIGSTYEETNPAVIYAYELPDGTRNNRVCQLANYTFVTWDPIFAPPGIGLTFRITDNMGLNSVTSDLHHSFSYTKENYFDYKASVTVIVNATAANQIGYSNSTNISKTLNGTIPLTVEYRCDDNGGNWTFVFHTKLDHLNINECSINNETLKDAMIVSCNEEQCVNNSGKVSITKNEINSTNSLPAKRKYNHTLCFNYLGRLIISQLLETSEFHDN